MRSARAPGLDVCGTSGQRRATVHRVLRTISDPGALLSGCELRTPIAPLRFPLIGVRQCENRCLREWSAADLKTYRQSGTCEAARDRDGGQSENIEGRGVLETNG